MCIITDRFHDRFLIVDDTVYHIGASFKDLGKGSFAFSEMEMKAQTLPGPADGPAGCGGGPYLR